MRSELRLVQIALIHSYESQLIMYFSSRHSPFPDCAWCATVGKRRLPHSRLFPFTGKMVQKYKNGKRRLQLEAGSQQHVSKLIMDYQVRFMQPFGERRSPGRLFPFCSLTSDCSCTVRFRPHSLGTPNRSRCESYRSS